jgi:hypothetical protein
MKRSIAELFNLLFGFRKTLAWLGLFIVGIVFRLQNYIDGAQFIDLMKATFAGFVAGNMAEHVMSFGKEYMASKTPQVADTDESNDKEEVEVKVEG